MVQGWVVPRDDSAGVLAPVSTRKKSGSASSRMSSSPWSSEYFLMLTDLPASGPRAKWPSAPGCVADLSGPISKIAAAANSPTWPGWAGQPIAAAISASTWFLCSMSDASRPS